MSGRDFAELTNSTTLDKICESEAKRIVDQKEYDNLIAKETEETIRFREEKENSPHLLYSRSLR